MKRAFTLIELLVVITIIAILCSILFPVFAQAKRSAKQTVCIVHMREIGMAMMMYKSDYDDNWPVACNDVPEPGFAPQQFWIGYDDNNGPLVDGYYGNVNQPAVNRPRTGMIDPYIKNEQIKVCPEQPRNWQMALAYNYFNTLAPSDYYITHPQAAGKEFAPGAYEVWTDSNGILNASAISDSMMEDPVATLIAWEHNARVPLCNFLQSVDWEENPPVWLDYLKEHFNFLHRDASTTLWADGHAKRTLFAQLKRPMFSVRKDIYN